MQNRYELKIKNPSNIYHELAVALAPYKEKETCSIEFIVEGSLKIPIIAIRYPGRKLVKKNVVKIRANSSLWANLFDFLVIPYIDGKAQAEREFTFWKLLIDYVEHKKNNTHFWKLLDELYAHNTISSEPPKLGGIDSKFYLLVLKWIWIQEDLNYRLNWKEINSPVSYTLQTRTGGVTSKGAGRGKFYAALVLSRNGFSLEQIKKIIPLY